MVSQQQVRQPAKIARPRLLLVEGSDDRHFFQRLIGRRQKLDIQVIEYGGTAQLGNFLANTLVIDPTFAELVEVVGVVRDADCDYRSAFQSVGDSLRRAGLPVPNSPLTPAIGNLDGTDIQVSVYIMPDNESSGDLETLILRAIEGRPALECVENYIECLKAQGQTIQLERKAKLHAFLASDPGDPTLQPGQAIDAGVIFWNSPAFADVHKFLDMLDAS